MHSPDISKSLDTNRNARLNPSSISELLQLHKLGVITKSQLRAGVGRWFPESNTSTPSPPADPQQNNDALCTPSPPKRCAVQIFPTDVTPVTKKTRTGKPTSQTALLRKISRNTTRRRFFTQCTN